MSLAIILSFVALPTVNKLSSSTTKVVTVKKDLTVGTQLTVDMLQLTEVGKVNLPQKSIQNVTDVLGCYLTIDMQSGDIVTARKAAKRLILPENKLRSMNPDEFALDVPLGAAENMRLLPNDIITIYKMDGDKSVIVPELQYVSVVATKTADGTNILAANQTSADGKALVPKMITFILTQRQASTLLALQASKESYYILMKYRGENDALIEQYLSAQRAYLQGGSVPTL